jgi:uncharacterized membrane protein
MEQLFKTVANYIALGVEAGAVLLILVGASEALYNVLRLLIAGKFVAGTRKEIWVRFGVWLLLGLEFELAADIVRSAISPSWSQIGQLAAIATIRTVLNYFLEKEIERYGAAGSKIEAVVPKQQAA